MKQATESTRWNHLGRSIPCSAALLVLLFSVQVQAQGATTDGPAAAAEEGTQKTAEVSPWLPKKAKPDKDPFGVAWHGQVRARGVGHGGKDFVKTNMLEKEYITQRARLTMAAKTQGGLKFGLQVQDSRIWGEELHTLNDKTANGLDLHQAWAQIELPHKMQLKLGRQEIVHDDARLIGNVGWVQRAQSFDAARLMGKSGHHKFELFWAMIQEREAGDPDGSVPQNRTGNVQLTGLHGTLIFGALKVAPAYYLRLNGSNNETRHTAGLRLDAKSGGFSGGGAFYYQMGSVDVPDAITGESKSNKIGTMLVAANVSYKLRGVATQPAFKVFADYLPGDGTPLSVFDTLYATNHKFYGEMDIFLALPKHTGGRGLMDVGAQVVAKVNKKVKLMATGHYFMTTKADKDGEKALGTEADIKAVFSPMPHVSVRALVAIFLPGEGMRSLKGIAPEPKLDNELFGYVTCDVTF